MATVQPSNNSELQLYQVLQQANLLKYFDIFITQGGDDVQQLCEAGEDEFLEIMALVGMASKPLHVRRLQKALQEWVANPAAFKVVKKCPTHVMSINGSSPHNVSPVHNLDWSSNIQDYQVTPPQSSAISTSTPWRSQTRDISPSDGSNVDDHSSSDSQQGDFRDTMKEFLYCQGDQPYSSCMGMSQSMLLEHQISAIATAAAMLAQDLPPFEPKSMPKKQISQEIALVMQLSPDDPSRMNALRKYAAIYGRFDSKRKNDRPMTLHEISVNEAAAQLCSHFPALLTRREELFPLARQVVRNSGYQYSKGHSRAAEVLVQPKLEMGEAVPATSTLILMSHEDSLSDLRAELTHLTNELSELAKEQDCIRSALRVLLEANDHDQMKRLTAEMDILNDKQTAMTKRKQRIVNKIAKHGKGSSKCSLTEASQIESESLTSSTHGPQLSKFVKGCGKYGGNGCYGYSEELLPSNPLGTMYMAALQNHKDSLFDEGLRIATQYGMSDFAKELIGMKSTREEFVSNTESGISESSEYAHISGLIPHSSATAFSTSFGGAISLSSSFSTYSISGSRTYMHPQPSPSSTSTVCSEPWALDISKPARHSSSTKAAKLVATNNNIHHEHNHKHKPSDLNPSESSLLCTDGLVAAADSSYTATKCSHQNIPSTADDDIIDKDSTSTLKTISTKCDNVMEVETRRSSRRKTGKADYYFNTDGENQEKRLCYESSRWSSSTSNEHAMRLSSLSSTSVLSPSTPMSTSI